MCSAEGGIFLYVTYQHDWHQVTIVVRQFLMAGSDEEASLRDSCSSSVKSAVPSRLRIHKDICHNTSGVPPPLPLSLAMVPMELYTWLLFHRI